MRTTMNVSLPKDLKKWVDDQVKAGGYGTTSEYLRDMLRRAREREARRAIDQKLIEALESGPPVVMDDEDWASIRRAAKAAVSPRVKTKR
jgi:antitoxin ParD1/3/4